MTRLLPGAACSLLLVACGQGDGVRPPEERRPSQDPRPARATEQTDAFYQVTTPIVDVLFVIDNSGWMREEQDQLTANFPVFMNHVLGSGLDYHLGVTSTDMVGRFSSNGTGGRLRTIGGLRFIDANTPNPVQVFAGMAGMGINGSPNQRGLGATYAALETRRDLDNQGFYRDEAAVHTIVISDEANGSGDDDPSLDEFVEWYSNLKVAAKDRTFSSIIDAASGSDYRRVTGQIGGIDWELDQGNWPVLLDRLGLLTSGLRSEFHLSRLPVELTLLVEVQAPVEGEVSPFNTVGFDTPDDYTYVYDPQRNSIRFLDFVPEALTRVVVTYDLLAAVQNRETDGR